MWLSLNHASTDCCLRWGMRVFPKGVPDLHNTSESYLNRNSASDVLYFGLYDGKAARHTTMKRVTARQCLKSDLK